jgi:uncharacterized protein YndB with AHSA1/START domain
MPTITESLIIARPPEEVFDAASDPEKQLMWDPEFTQSVEKLTPGPLSRGSRYRGKFKQFGTMEYEFADFERPKRFSHLTMMPMGEMSHTFTFEQVPEGTRLTQEGRLKPRLLGRIMWPMMSRMLRKRFRTIVSEVDEYLSTSTSAPEETTT